MPITEGELVPSPVWSGLAAIQLHTGYNQWANERILGKMAELSDAELHAPEQTDHGSAFQLLLHAVDTEWGWRIICQDGVVTPLLWEVETLPEVAAVTHLWQKEHEQMCAYLNSLQEADLGREIDFGSLFGQQPKRAQLLHLLSHILYHSNGHRAELARYLTQCGHSPGNMAFLDYLDQANTSA